MHGASITGQRGLKVGGRLPHVFLLPTRNFLRSEWGTLALGSMDIGLRAMTCSPSNLTGNGGCIFQFLYTYARISFLFYFYRCIAAILSSNMDLSLWHAAKNSMKGEWAKVCAFFVVRLVNFRRRIEAV